MNIYYFFVKKTDLLLVSLSTGLGNVKFRGMKFIPNTLIKYNHLHHLPLYILISFQYNYSILTRHNQEFKHN